MASSHCQLSSGQSPVTSPRSSRFKRALCIKTTPDLAEQRPLPARLPLPAFSFPALPMGTVYTQSIITPSTTRHPARQHRRSSAVSTPRPTQRQSQFYPPVPPLPTDLSTLSPPILSKPSAKPRPAPLDLQQQSNTSGTFLLAPSPSHSPSLTPRPRFQSSRALSTTNTTISTCPTLLSDDQTHTPSSPAFSYHTDDQCRKASRQTHVLPITPSEHACFACLIEKDLPKYEDDEEEDDDDDDEFWECIGSRKDNDVAEWVRKCSFTAGPQEEGLETIQGGWVRAL